MAFTLEQKREWAIAKKLRDDNDFLNLLHHRIKKAHDMQEEAGKILEKVKLELKQFLRNADRDNLKWKKKEIDFSKNHWSMLFDSETDHEMAKKGRAKLPVSEFSYIKMFQNK